MTFRGEVTGIGKGMVVMNEKGEKRKISTHFGRAAKRSTVWPYVQSIEPSAISAKCIEGGSGRRGKDRMRVLM